MGPKELVDYAKDKHYFSDKRAGRTPHQTMNSKLCVDIKRRGNSSDFVRTEPGKFYLRSLVSTPNEIYIAKPQVKPQTHEEVLVFPSKWLDQRKSIQGVSQSWRTLYSRILRPTVCSYMNRLAAESTDQFRQVLTYIMVRRGSKVLAYKRGNYNRVEDYLRGSYCVGFGGHIGRQDHTLFNERDMGVFDGAIRELHEELTLPKADRDRLKNGEGMRCVGFINDNSSEAGRRHFAFVFQYDAYDDSDWDRPTRGEKSITQLQWLEPTAAPVPIWEFEYWSQLCLREFLPSIINTAPAYRLLRRTRLSPPSVLCVVGGVGSGKSEATRILKERFGYHVVNSGQVMAELLGVPPIPATSREDFQNRSEAFISRKEGFSAFAARLWDGVESCKCERVLIDGVRHHQTLEHLREAAGRRGLGVLSVHTPPDVAYRLFESRERKEISFFDFLHLRNAPVEREVAELIRHADAVLYNWAGRLIDYRRTVASLMEEITRGS